MRLISRSVLREVWPPFLLGFAAYTFILLIRTILFLADFAVRRSASLLEVSRLVVLSLPWIVVLTLPMAFLLGVLVGLGRLAADAELTALRSCGVGRGALYRPVLGAAAGLGLVVLLLYAAVLPVSNAALERAMTRVAATSIVNVVSPRTFREPRPGILLFFDRIAPDARSFEGVFLKLGEEGDPPNRVIVARRGNLTIEEDRLWLDLYDSTVHEVDPDDPSRYRTSRNSSQRLLLAGQPSNPAGTRVSSSASPRSQSLPELWRTARSLSPGDPARRLALVELHKKFAIPCACLVFALIGLPLAESMRRGGRGGSFALSLLILLLYYVILTGGETWAQEGRVPPALAMWLPNFLLLAAGIVAALRKPSGRAPHPPRPLPEPAPAAGAPPARRTRTPTLTFSRAALAARSPLRFLSLADRYVLARFFLALALVLGSAILIAVVVDYADKVDEVARHAPPTAVLLGYYRYFVLSITIQIAPFVVLLATLVGLGLLSRSNEDTAFLASGVSLRRLAAPLLVVTGLGAVAAFTVGEYVLPFAEQRQERFRNVIYGRAPDFGTQSATQHNWYLARDGRIWFREDTEPGHDLLRGVSVFEFGSDFRLVKRIEARQAKWSGGRWILRQGWTRSFSGSDLMPYRTFLDESVAGDPPRFLVAGRRRPEEMRFRELQQLTRRLRASGYATPGLETALQAKLAQPALLPIMALLAVPFAFRIGRRGALAGIGVGLLLGILALVTAAFSTKLGEVGALPPGLAAWSPDVLFGLTAAFFLARMRT
jgi:LPS export ABC transporter permease LptF/LPS export ABC transporter permease LptG